MKTRWLRMIQIKKEEDVISHILFRYICIIGFQNKRATTRS